ncbi:transglutaminase domain-containing protein [Flavobacterium gyeonganense]|uniref:Transglutaminase domain-containing protein n=1 Tax=Flavobacterium gyeonganense TaxID=1310418 RepID=A0ABV5H584_9FLAO
MKISNLVLVVLLISAFEPCTAQTKSFSIAGENSEELEKVIKHFKKKGDDQKLKSAYFLISNMKNKGTYINDLVDSHGISVGFNISNFKNENEEKKWLDSVTSIRGKLHEYENFLPDVKNISAQFLINNIDRAFEVKQKSPFCKGISDADFYEYILPYRVNTEKLEFWRDSVLNDFSKEQIDSIYNFSTVLAATNYVDKIYQKRFKFGERRYFKEKKVRSYSELIKDKEGKCNDMCNLVVLALRALGIPSGFDSIKYKRASNDVGHEWCFVKDIKTDKNYPFDALSNNGPGFFNLPYKNAPKVLRMQFTIVTDNSIQTQEITIYPDFFNSNFLDVTTEYFETTNVAIPLEKKHQEPLYLSIWHKGWWKPIAYFYDPNQLIARFNNVSKDNLYCLTKYRFSTIEQVNEPFIVNKFGEIKYCNSTELKKEISLNSYQNKELKKAKNNTEILDFDTQQKICRKVVEEDVKKDEWQNFSEVSLKTNTLYLLVDDATKTQKVFMLKNDGSVDWY